jgi:hypothetical protein
LQTGQAGRRLIFSLFFKDGGFAIVFVAVCDNQLVIYHQYSNLDEFLVLTRLRFALFRIMLTSENPVDNGKNKNKRSHKKKDRPDNIKKMKN